jgi:hypothetical protein
VVLKLGVLTAKYYDVTKEPTKTRTWPDFLVRLKQRKRDMSFVTWNVRSLYRFGSPMTVARELAKYKLDLEGVQPGIKIFCGKGKENHQLGKTCFVHQRIVSSIKRVQFVNARMSYIMLRGRWRKSLL